MKKVLREKILSQRRALSDSEIEAMSTMITTKFIEWASRQEHPRHVALYRPVRAEVLTNKIANWLISKGIRLCYPRIDSTLPAVMQMHTVENPHIGNWIKGPHGIDEPHPQAPIVRPTDLGWILVPGVAFGPQGERIGSGAGFYDRYLCKTGKALRIALAYDFQVIESEIDEEAWDEEVHLIFTDSRIIDFR